MGIEEMSMARPSSGAGLAIAASALLKVRFDR